mmetsp:Transcript_45446/g.128243  ORF Transcript_45446/g.128243 Transcript_45446/m.128243 type:complete len:213 (-) Transcript_45446:34-672(-)
MFLKPSRSMSSSPTSMRSTNRKGVSMSYPIPPPLLLAKMLLYRAVSQRMMSCVSSSAMSGSTPASWGKASDRGFTARPKVTRYSCQLTRPSKRLELLLRKSSNESRNERIAGLDEAAAANALASSSYAGFFPKAARGNRRGLSEVRKDRRLDNRDVCLRLGWDLADDTSAWAMGRENALAVEMISGMMNWRLHVGRTHAIASASRYTVASLL